MKFLNSYNFFNNNQYGFRKSLSTNRALVSVTKYIYENILVTIIKF